MICLPICHNQLYLLQTNKMSRSVGWSQLSRTKSKEIKKMKRRGEYECRVIQSVSNNYYLCHQYDVSCMICRSKEELKEEINRYSTIQSSFFTHIYKICMRSEPDDSKTFLCLLTRYKEKPELSLAQTIDRIDISLPEAIDIFRTGLTKLAKAGITHNSINLESISIQNKQLKIGLPLFASMERQLRKRGQFKQTNRFACPEAKEGHQLSIASDVWDAGIVLLQIALKSPLDNVKFSQQYILDMLASIKSQKDRTIIKRMLDRDFKKRSNLNWIFGEQNIHQSNKKAHERQLDRISLFDISTFQDIRVHKNNRSHYQQPKLHALSEQYALEVRQRPEDLLISVINQRIQQPILSRIFVKSQIPSYVRNQLIYQLTNDGFLSIKIPQNISKNTDFNNNPEEQIIKKKKSKEFPLNSMLNLKGFYNKQCIKKGQGFLISHNMILTTARFLYDRLTKFPTLQIQIMHQLTRSRMSNYSSHFPEKYMSSSEEESTKYDYGLIVLEKSVQKALQISLLFDFDEERLAEWADEASQPLQYRYEVNQITYQRDLLDHPGQKIRQLNTQDKDEGCPLMIQFENGQFLATGIVLDNKKCLLFTAEDITNIYRWAAQAPDMKEGRDRFHYSFRAFSADKFAFWHPSIETQFLTIMESTVETINNLYQSQQFLLAGFIYERMIQTLPTQILETDFIEKVIEIYEVSYGKNYPNLAYLYTRLGIKLSQKDEIIQSLKILQKADSILRQNPFNRHFYSAFLQKLAYMYEMNMNIQETFNSLRKSIEISQQNNYWWCLERSHYFNGKIEIAYKTIPEGISQLSKSINISEKYLEGGRNPAAYVILANYHFNQSSNLQALLLLEKSFQIMNYDPSVEQQATRLFDVLAKQTIENFNFLTSEQLVQVIHRIINKHLGSRIQYLTEMQIKSLI